LAARPILERLDEALVGLLDRRVLDRQGNPTNDEHVADQVLANVTGKVLKDLLAGRRKLGLSGWHFGHRRNVRLKDELLKHLKSGHMADVVRLAAVIWAREHLYGPDA
jgi:hypothetical protein